MKKKIFKAFITGKIATWIAAGVFLISGCGKSELFAYKPQSHIIAEDEKPTRQEEIVVEKIAEEELGGPVIESNVLYFDKDDKDAGLVLGFPFVYQGIGVDYDGNFESDFTSDVIPEKYLPIQEQDGVSGDALIKTENTEEPEFPMSFGKVNSKEFRQATFVAMGEPQLGTRLVPSNDSDDPDPVEEQFVINGYEAHVTIIFSKAGPLGKVTQTLTGKDGRTYAKVRNWDGTFGFLQYSYEYLDEITNEPKYVRVMVKFFGDPTEEQAVEFLDRLDIQYVGENVEIGVEKDA